MTELRKAAEMALETLCVGANDAVPNDIDERFEQAIQALRQALAQPEQEPVAGKGKEFSEQLKLCARNVAFAASGRVDMSSAAMQEMFALIDHVCVGLDSPPALAQPEQEPVTLLPDGSAFGVMSFPLPESHWLYAEREYRDGEYEPVELGKPILTHELRGAVVSAVRYAIRGATNCGKEMDFDPDALVQNAVYALCGPYTKSVDAVNMSQERVDETAKREHEPVAWMTHINGLNPLFHKTRASALNCQTKPTPLYTAPPKREWVGLTDEDKQEAFDETQEASGGFWEFADYLEAKLKEKNG